MKNKIFFKHDTDGVITYINFLPNERIEENLASGVIVNKADFPEYDESLGIPNYYYDGNAVSISYIPRVDPFTNLMEKLSDEKNKVVFLENELLIAKGLI